MHFYFLSGTRGGINHETQGYGSSEEVEAVAQVRAGHQYTVRNGQGN
jgi:hypothetical protein